jgi:hypothetical protein
MRKYLTSLLLVTTLAGSTGACAVRMYDEPRVDYHRWNGREERAYRIYLVERRREYLEFRRLDRREQEAYWAWRHSHSDRDLDHRDRR